ncbi:FG-GAP-like repeat-containing protein [Weeksella virosa]|uniref:Secretion system C-terminal sorting domain-containing protein n=1 Tax=Weeksella virosa (strain ATCC 43766 / DSM 16922 / JCM 21250 / CCUG 30538 / CDC 9751 / IAM 14551 / NBRC 16016 / NCTC 11634 / CL345/78) TaxID=865938 RepID=F0P0X8_WEEVC|nr:FG-GAP-like repeat-containing protein [Weeksella virosa]ADX68562.1 hypothetical protein Weevi_1874 [Weeksella virosa DSM 16922]VEH63779.1 Por secretion system C-terminal sorting domain [Weeksella virosa]
MKKVFPLLVLLPFGMKAQMFTEVNTNLKNYYYSSADIGDFDGDGFLDVIMNGAIDSDMSGDVDKTHNEIYRNNNGVFELYGELGDNSTHLGDIKFIDFDNDGLLDVVSTGLSYRDIVNYQQYRFRNNGNGFEMIKNIPGKIYGSIEVFDFNHDGKQDYAINGVQFIDGKGFVYKLDLYTNTGKDFNIEHGWLPGTQNGSFKILDLNNDNFLDAAVFGYDENQEPTFTIYKNNQGTLEISQKLNGIIDGKLAYADFNADGFLDLVVTGTDEDSNEYLSVLWNDGNGFFTPTVINDEGLNGASVDVGDLNNDGYYDFIIIGNDDNYEGHVKIFIYYPDEENFNKALDTGLYNLGSNGTIRLFDFNNDNHLDVLMSGFDWSDPDMPSLNKLFENTSAEKNLPPTPPTNLYLEKNNNKYYFSWEGATDDKTPTKALRYEINVGSSSGSHDIAKYIVTTPSWFLELDDNHENIYWSVKSIDSSFSFSASSKENLSISNIGKSHQIKVYPNPSSEKIYIEAQNITSVNLYDLQGSKIMIKMNNDKSIDISDLENGMYILKVKIDDKTFTKKIIKK